MEALARERGHWQDLGDVQEMLRRELIDPARPVRFFDAIEPQLYRSPAVDARSFRRAVEDAFGAG